ncbi:IS1182 family transposase [Sphingobacterium sp. LRF_L2]|uniref:IS1182 family transposase n=1 Tax=Sphingobacterium sp. LRF_L2 TaxID=3369421 RepID=UPI003F622057
MQGRKVYQESLFVNFQLSDYVPHDNIYRRILGVIDFDHLYKLTLPYYGREGQKSIDPVVFMKFMLVGYLENINSDRRIIEMSRMRMDILFFLGYNIDEPLPWHSTLSRTRQLYGQEVFTSIFQQILSLCIDKGMVSGKRQAVDGFFIKANASLDNMVRRDILEDAEMYAKELEENVEKPSPRTIELPKGNERRHSGLAPKKNPSNATHVNPNDPDAKMSVKSGKVTALNYLGEVSADTASHVVTHVQAFTADKHDSQCLPQVLDVLVKNLLVNGLEVSEILADRGFSGGEGLRSLEQMGIKGYIPNRPQVVYERKGFVYDPQRDSYTCRNNTTLPFKGMSGYTNKEYRTSCADCKGCPLQSICEGYSAKRKYAVVLTNIHKPYYDRMHERMQGKKASKMMKIRQSTVEPVIGNLVNHYGMKKVNTIGLAQANKCLTASAAAYNLKKLMKYIPMLRKKALSMSSRIGINNITAFVHNILSLKTTLKNYFAAKTTLYSGLN